ncbi:hypothetical protein HMPREF9946_02199 [Acetobacteraceae bacterium AT-5844]|nr:hypothetical protein HMPREF9946_02199 [Acetobacteraceae bacterium AT-5844]
MKHRPSILVEISRHHARRMLDRQIRTEIAVMRRYPQPTYTHEQRAVAIAVLRAEMRKRGKVAA